MEVESVLISDIHFSMANLEPATKALLSALKAANRLEVPLIIAGDLTDGKAIIRGEVANRLIDIFASNTNVETIIIPGNHDLINEKSSDHALNFLHTIPGVTVYNSATYIKHLDLWVIPYMADPSLFLQQLAKIKRGSKIIIHQGVQGANMGHYVLDKSSLHKEVFADYRVISGHYHAGQDIKCGRPRLGAVGLFTYIGSPYTQSFSEANDPPKGYAVLEASGLLLREEVPLRKHVVIELDVTKMALNVEWKENDILWFKVKGDASQVNKLTKKKIASLFNLAHTNFRLDLIPNESDKTLTKEQKVDFASDEVLDLLISKLSETDTEKKNLKALWREIVNG
jgi:DNA repair exonuclease SbcCD nuclease subunit